MTILSVVRFLLLLLVLITFSAAGVLAGPAPVGSPVGSTIGFSPTWDTNNQYVYLGTYAGNDDLATVSQILSDQGLLSTGVYLIGKNDQPFVGFTMIGLGSTSGTWSSDGQAGSINFIVIKGGSQFALYALANPFVPGLAYDWSTADLFNGGGQQPALSHFSGLSQVPEPSSGLLLAGGLLLLGALQLSRTLGIGIH